MLLLLQNVVARFVVIGSIDKDYSQFHTTLNAMFSQLIFFTRVVNYLNAIFEKYYFHLNQPYFYAYITRSREWHYLHHANSNNNNKSMKDRRSP